MLKPLLPLCSLLLFAITASPQAKIIYPHKDPHKEVKEQMLTSMIDVMVGKGVTSKVIASEKVFLWANHHQDLGHSAKNNKLPIPLFMSKDDSNSDVLYNMAKDICQCDLEEKNLGGLFVASPFVAAKMYFRRGWAGHGANDLDGVAAPIVIAYHELSHIYDYLSNAQWFFDMATIMDSRYKNLAEQSAVEKQNSFSLSLKRIKGVPLSLRRSYGHNELFKVKNFYSIQEVE